MKRVGLYPGSFDPLTYGHIGIVRGALRLFDHLVIAIGVHPSKTPMFTAAQRATLIEDVVAPLAAAAAGVTFEVRTFSNLVTQLATEVKATALVRGLRDGSNLDDEMPMAGMNALLAPGVQTLFLPATIETRHITATLVRQIAIMGGDVSPFVPQGVADALRIKFKKSP